MAGNKAANMPKFTKESILKFERYQERRDLLSALLKDGERYTTKEVDTLIAKFMKGRVK